MWKDSRKEDNMWIQFGPHPNPQPHQPLLHPLNTGAPGPQCTLRCGSINAQKQVLLLCLDALNAKLA